MTVIESTWRRHAARAAVVLLLAIPALAGLNQHAGAAAENRNLAPWPPMPRTWPAMLETPAKLNAWVNDHFGYRTGLVKLNNRIRFALFEDFPSIQMAKGQHGRYFLAAHGTNVPPYQALTNVCGKLSHADPSTIPHLNRMFDGFHAMGLQPRLMIVPSAPVVHSEDAPPWLVGECGAWETPVTEVLASPALSAQARAAMYFPLREMREIKKSAVLFPQTWFHWTGPGLDQVARLSLTQFWQRPLDVAPPLKTRSMEQHSDVSHLFDGVSLSSVIVQPDLDASHIKGCFGADCFPELGDATRVLGDVSRFDNPQAPPRRLLMITDSFGSKISPWYARYYRHVEQVATNAVEQLTPEQLEKFKTYLFRDPAGTDMLLLYHDGGAMYNTLRIGTERMLPPAPPPAAPAPAR